MWIPSLLAVDLSPARVLEVLLGLELKGVVTQLPGMYFTATRGK